MKDIFCFWLFNLLTGILDRRKQIWFERVEFWAFKPFSRSSEKNRVTFSLHFFFSFFAMLPILKNDVRCWTASFFFNQTRVQRPPSGSKNSGNIWSLFRDHLCRRYSEVVVSSGLTVVTFRVWTLKDIANWW